MSNTEFARFICVALDSKMQVPRVVAEADIEDKILHKMVDQQAISPLLDYKVYELKKFKKRYD